VNWFPLPIVPRFVSSGPPPVRGLTGPSAREGRRVIRISIKIRQLWYFRSHKSLPDGEVGESANRERRELRTFESSAPNLNLTPMGVSLRSLEGTHELV
jgi:hypothetical protein